MKSLNKSNQKGFTIIEVLIVLAIAGIIMVIIFLAVPALQRNSRNTQRTNDVAHMSGLISEWQSNNTGTALTSLVNTVPANPPVSGALYLGNEKFSRIVFANWGTPTSTIPGTLPTTLDNGYVYTNANCNGNTPQSGGGASSVALYYVTEISGGTSPHCVAAS